MLAVERASTSVLYAWDSPEVPASLARVVLSTDKNATRPADIFAAMRQR